MEEPKSKELAHEAIVPPFPTPRSPGGERECPEAEPATGAVDLKWAGQSPDAHRATLRLREAVAFAMGIDTMQVHASFGSSGSIDAIFTAASVLQSEMRRASLARESAEMSSMLDEEPLDANRARQRLEELEAQRPRWSCLLSSPVHPHHFESARCKALHLEMVPLGETYRFDADAFIEAMDRVQPSLVVLATPNNPTGVPIPDADLLRVLDHAPEGAWVVLDRSLVNVEPEASTRELLAHYAAKNLIVVHSFSAYKRMAQDRVGVALFSNSELARELGPFFPSCLTLDGVAKALYWVTKEGGIRPEPAAVRNIEMSRALLGAFVSRHDGFSVSDFASDFALLNLPPRYDASFLSRYLAARGIEVLSGSALTQPDPRVIRIHVGGPARNVRKLISTLAAPDIAGR